MPERRLSSGGRWLPGALAVLAALSAAAWISFGVPHFLVDDAYISFRYAENLAQGAGLVYNPGELVEGYTNFLWIIILALLRWLGTDIPAAARLLGFALGIGELFLTLALAGRVFQGRWRPLRWVPFLWLASNHAQWLWAMSGMETTLFAFLITLGLVLATGPLTPAHATASAAVWFLATLTRPEGLILFLVDCAWGLRRRRDAVGRRAVVHAAVLYLGLLASYLAWKWFYFGALLPNTFYAKNVGRWHLLANGLGYLKAFVVDFGFGAGLVGVLAGLIWAPRGCDRSRLQLLSLTLAVFMLYLLSVGGDIYYYSRFLTPLLPLFYTALVASSLSAGERLFSASPRKAVAFTVILSLLVHASGVALQERRYRTAWSDDANIMRLREKVGLWLGENYPPSTVMASVDAGIVPFYSRFRNIDLVGLTNKEIGRREVANPGALAHEKHNTSYVLSQEPLFLAIIPKESLQPLPWQPGMRLQFPEDFRTSFQEMAPYPAHVELFQTPAFHERYQFTTFVIDAKTFFYSFLRLPAGAIPQTQALRNLGWTHLEYGSFDQGMSLLVQALRLRPDDPLLQSTISKALETFGTQLDTAAWRREVEGITRGRDRGDIPGGN